MQTSYNSLYGKCLRYLEALPLGQDTSTYDIYNAMYGGKHAPAREVDKRAAQRQMVACYIYRIKKRSKYRPWYIARSELLRYGYVKQRKGRLDAIP